MPIVMRRIEMSQRLWDITKAIVQREYKTMVAETGKARGDRKRQLQTYTLPDYVEILRLFGEAKTFYS